jgi:hypothetical protein
MPSAKRRSFSRVMGKESGGDIDDGRPNTAAFLYSAA